MALTVEDYVELSITPDLMQAAEEKRARVIREIEADGRKHWAYSPGCDVSGFLAEQLVIRYLGAEDKDRRGYDLDLVGMRLEVKTITAKFCPPVTFDAAVHNYQSTDADLYVFTRILADFSRGWILGAIGCKEFLERARHVRKGESPGPGLPPLRARDGKLLPIADLYPIEKLVRMAEARRLKLAPSSRGGTSGEIWANPEAERARRMTVPEWVAEYERNERPI